MFTALILFSLTVPAEPQKEKEFSAEAKKELMKLEGKWNLVKFAAQGMESDVMDRKVSFVFKGTEVTLKSADKEKTETLRITAFDLSTDPKCIDLVEKREGRPDRTLEGIYKIDGDTLQIAHSVLNEGKNRPTSFEKPGERVFVWTLKRVKE
jgi:uncharacterized protein (TIGR03067 family)